MNESSGAESNATEEEPGWNGATGVRWLANHQRLNAMLTPFGEAVFDRLGDIQGGHALDVGCGTGETTAALGERVGESGSATGIDISALLIAHARKRYESEHINFRVGDAGNIDLGAGYDVVMSRIGSTFFADPVTAFAHIRASLSDGAWLGMVVWQEASENEWVHVPLKAVAPLIDLPEPPAPRTPGAFAFADPGYVRSVLEDSGFSDVDVVEFRKPVVVGHDPVDAAHFLLGVLPTGPLLDPIDRDTTASEVDAVAKAFGDHVGEIVLEGASWIVSARK